MLVSRPKWGELGGWLYLNCLRHRLRVFFFFWWFENDLLLTLRKLQLCLLVLCMLWISPRGSGVGSIYQHLRYSLFLAVRRHILGTDLKNQLHLREACLNGILLNLLGKYQRYIWCLDIYSKYISNGMGSSHYIHISSTHPTPSRHGPSQCSDKCPKF